jgi:hypothetical protein
VTGHGRGSGITVDQAYVQVWTLAGGKVQRIVSRFDLETALADDGAE